MISKREWWHVTRKFKDGIPLSWLIGVKYYYVHSLKIAGFEFLYKRDIEAFIKEMDERYDYDPEDEF